MTFKGRWGPILLVSAVGCVAFVGVLYARGGSGLLRAVLLVWMGAAAVGLPLLYIWAGVWRVGRWAREGLVAIAEVTEVDLGQDDDGKPQARGHRIVHHPQLGAYHDRFQLGGEWIEEIRVGSTLEVIVAPDATRSWLTLGLKRTPSA